MNYPGLILALLIGVASGFVARGWLKKPKSKWPRPNYDETAQPHFLFIVTLPFSGSTALAKLLNTSPRTMILQDRAEGQWLVPGLCESDRWEGNKEVDYGSVKAVWLHTYQSTKRLTQNIDFVIEKSPPNMMRLEKLLAQFDQYSCIANNRNPYACCSSMLYRNHDAKNMTPHQRQVVLEQLAHDWLLRSKNLRALIDKLKMPKLSYEDFCQDPSALLNTLSLPDDLKETVDPKANVKVKDYESQPISSQNERQISQLTSQEIDHISKILETESELLHFFGYKIQGSP